MSKENLFKNWLRFNKDLLEHLRETRTFDPNSGQVSVVVDDSVLHDKLISERRSLKIDLMKELGADRDVLVQEAQELIESGYEYIPDMITYIRNTHGRDMGYFDDEVSKRKLDLSDELTPELIQEMIATINSERYSALYLANEVEESSIQL